MALIQDSLTVDILKPSRKAEVLSIEHRPFYSISKPILSLAIQGGESKEQYFVSSIGSSDKLKADNAGKSLYPSIDCVIRLSVNLLQTSSCKLNDKFYSIFMGVWLFHFSLLWFEELDYVVY